MHSSLKFSVGKAAAAAVFAEQAYFQGFQAEQAQSGLFGRASNARVGILAEQAEIGGNRRIRSILVRQNLGVI